MNSAGPTIKTKHDSVVQRDKALGTLADSTMREYEKRADGLLRTADVHSCDVWAIVEGSCDTRASWIAASAALKFVLPRRIRAAKSKLDKLERDAGTPSNPPDFAYQVDRALFDLCWCANQLASTPSTSPDWYPPKPNRKLGASKKNSVPGLPKHWDMSIATILSTTKKLPAGSLPAHDATLLWLAQRFTGCRTEELVLGVKVVISSDGRTLTAKVLGAKRGPNAGQAEREIQRHTDGWPASALAEILGRGKAKQIQMEERYKEAYRKRVQRAGKMVTPERDARTRPTTYTARNVFASELASAVVGKVGRAKGMGHRSTKSGRYYTDGIKGSGTVKPPLAIRATDAVKVRAPYKSSKVASVVAEDLLFAGPSKRMKKKP